MSTGTKLDWTKVKEAVDAIPQMPRQPILVEMTETSAEALFAELKHLRGQVQDLHTRDSQLITENRALVKNCLACVVQAQVPMVKPAGETVLEVHISVPHPNYPYGRPQ